MADNFIDCRTGAVTDRIDAQICIVGAGAAGLTLARSLGDKIPGVILIESGGLDLDGATQGLYVAKNLGLPYFDLAASRLRFFGGTTNHWSGYCRANDDIDYEGRPTLNLPKWPVSHDALAPFIEQAAALLGIESKFFEPRYFFEREGFKPDQTIGDDKGVLETKVFQIATDIRLGKKYREELAGFQDFRAYLHLNATHVQLAANGGSVEHLVCKTLNGKEVRVTAKHFVLACHAIENARLLLVSNDVMKTGIGNAFDHVGRYFMDHVQIFASKFIPNSNFPALYNAQYALARNLNANLGFTDTALRELDILQYYCRFQSRYTSEAIAQSIIAVRQGFMEPGDLDYLKDVSAVLADLSGAIEFSLSRFGRYKLRSGQETRFASLLPAYFLMDHRIEQAPNPKSRIVISDRRDALGNLIADLDWRLSEPDYKSFKVAQAKIAAELAARGLGRCELEEITPELVDSRVKGHYHNIGTTRMSAEPRDGVVDPDGRVHGVANLHVAGSSIFPTAGYSGPTMMIIGFALRLADRLKQSLHT
jgi:choline dehydrogenase-like flavoprotein